MPPARIAIVGGGISGLATALFLRRQLPAAAVAITVWEAAPGPQEAGAGIQIPPNAARLLARCGLFSTDAAEQQRPPGWGALAPSQLQMRRYADGSLLASTPLGAATAVFGAPYLVIHRADYQQALYAAVRATDIVVEFDAAVTAVESCGDGSSPARLIVAGRSEAVEADLVVGADGVGSLLRKAVGQNDAQAQVHDHWAYRALVPAEAMKSDASLAELIDSPSSTVWIGPDRHVVSYPIREGAVYNMVLINGSPAGPRPARGSSAAYDRAVPPAAVRAHYADFEPRVLAALALTDDFAAWPLPDAIDLDEWTRGNVALIGDAAHPMPPYMAQGAAQAVEDGAVLAQCVARALALNGTPAALLETYRALRHPRATRVAAESVANGQRWHMADGPAQEARDAAMKEALKKGPPLPPPGVKVPIPTAMPPAEVNFADPRFQFWLFGLDVEDEARRALEQVGRLP